jgi:hypothetical protein
MRVYTEDEEAALREVLTDLHRRSQHHVAPTIGSLVATWAKFVQEVERGYECSIYDYTNDLSTRDLLDEVIDSVPVTLGKEIEEELQQWDDRYRLATRPSDKPLFPGPDVAQRPRWRRIPRNLRGELLEDLRSEGLING